MTGTDLCAHPADDARRSLALATRILGNVVTVDDERAKLSCIARTAARVWR